MKIDWENVTNYLENVGSVDKVFSFPKSQSAVQITNRGSANLIYTIGSQSGTLTPTQSVKVTETISSFTLRSSAGSQLFECWGAEAGTEQDEPETDLASLASSLADITTKQGDITQLNTIDKTSVVNALKEIKTQANSNATSVSNIGNGSPKGTYATTTALQTAFPTGTTGIYIVTADGKWYYWSGSAWTAGGVYQSTGLASNAGDQLVQILNLCDFTKLTMNAYLGASGAVVSASNYAYSDYIPVTVGTTYCWYGAFNISFQAIAYDSNKNFIRNIYATDLGGVYHAYTYTVPAGTAYIRFNMGVTQANTMVVAGTSYPASYTPYGQQLLSANLGSGIKNSTDLQYMKIDPTNQNTALGQTALQNPIPSKYNVAVGYNALSKNTDDGSQDAGRYNVAVGFQALMNNTIGNHNTAVGYNAAQSITTGTGDTAYGEDALLQETTGTGNTAIGQRALQNSLGAQNNTAVGVSAMYWDTTSNVTGTDNTAIGHYAGSRVSSDTDLTFLGHFSNKDLTTNVYSDSTALGANAVVSKSHQVMLGSPNVTVVDTYGDFESLTNGRGLILLSPSGTKYKLAISDAGALTITAV